MKRGSPEYSARMREICNTYLTQEAREKSGRTRKGRPQTPEAVLKNALGNAFLGPRTVIAILRYRAAGHSMGETAKRFKVNKSTVVNIVNGKKYKWVKRPAGM
ncbi:hypothetical protein FACS1894140_5310 [Spirochaetia bacterium]|nr:hypothetical protein FACS1894140_5310 [Spirochaetia bacterium]